MACVPILNRRKGYQFEAIVKLHSLISVPYVNAVTFAKLRLLNARHSSQYSPRVEIRNHTVTWNTEHRFLCRFRSNMETTILEPNILKISIRMVSFFFRRTLYTFAILFFILLGLLLTKPTTIRSGWLEPLDFSHRIAPGRRRSKIGLRQILMFLEIIGRYLATLVEKLDRQY
ncbi:hypothetical protein AHF37_11979 [Paragonimus kellicotti]|nr:hypothetical protein AHF37_11979 [Paragonimus kellicotti]